MEADLSAAHHAEYQLSGGILNVILGNQIMEKRTVLRDRPLVVKGGAVSRFLFLNLPFIFATYPPASDGQPSSAGIFGLAGLPPYPPYVAARRRGLLPRVFTLTLAGGCSLLRTEKIAPFCAFHSQAPCPVRTFLTGFPVRPGMTARQIVPPFRLQRYEKILTFVGCKIK